MTQGSPSSGSDWGPAQNGSNNGFSVLSVSDKSLRCVAGLLDDFCQRLSLMRPRSGSPWLHFLPRRSVRVRFVLRPFQAGASFSAPGIFNPPPQCRMLLTLTSRYTDRKCASALSTFKIASTMTSQTRTHSSHHHHHDNAYLTSTNKSDAGVRITRIGLYVNLAMAIGKGIGGYVFHSQGKAAFHLHSY